MPLNPGSPGRDFSTGAPTPPGGASTPGGKPNDKDLSGDTGSQSQLDVLPKGPGDVGGLGLANTQPKPRGQAQKWTIASVEMEVPVSVTGQFTVDDMQLNAIGGVFTEITSVNQSHPITQWIRGQQETITLVSEFWAQHYKDSITQQFQDLLRLARRDEDLMRPPICMFSFGTKLSMQCFVEHVSNIAFGPLRPDGTPQRIRFTLTLRNYIPSLVAKTDPSNVSHQSRERYAKAGDTFESIAADEYGDALMGEYLRRWLGYHPDLAVGDKVHILTTDYIAQQGPVLPVSPILYAMMTNPKFAALLFSARSGSLAVP